MKHIHAQHAPPASGSYSHAVVSGGWIITSGQLPVDPATGVLVDGDVQDQTRKSLENVGRVLAAAGSDLSRAVKLTVYLADITDLPAVNAAYATCLDPPFPARSAIGVAGLPLGAALEIEAIAEAANTTEASHGHR